MKKSKLRIFGTIVSILLVLFFIATIVYRDYISQLITVEVQLYGSIVLFIATTFSEILPQYIGPQLILIQAGLLGFPPYLLALIVLAGSTSGTLLGFYLGKRYGEPIIEAFYNKQENKRIENAINKYGVIFVTLAAISPLPYLPIVFGALGMKLKNILFFGLLPRLLTLIFISLFFI